jgi:hypothetical protein
MGSRTIDLPFYAVLGNHDYGGSVAGVELGGVGNEFVKGPVEVAYTGHSDKWIMPSTFYTMVQKNVGFIMLDTNSIIWNNTENGDQQAWYPTALMEVSAADWVIVAGHHPFRSNGSHGNAGNYEGVDVSARLLRPKLTKKVARRRTRFSSIDRVNSPTSETRLTAVRC